MNNKKDVGILGLGVMGRGLAINILREGFSVSVYNRYEDSEKDVVSSFLKKHQKKRKVIRYHGYIFICFVIIQTKKNNSNG